MLFVAEEGKELKQEFIEFLIECFDRVYHSVSVKRYDGCGNGCFTCTSPLCIPSNNKFIDKEGNTRIIGVEITEWKGKTVLIISADRNKMYTECTPDITGIMEKCNYKRLFKYRESGENCLLTDYEYVSSAQKYTVLVEVNRKKKQKIVKEKKKIVKYKDNPHIVPLIEYIQCPDCKGSGEGKEVTKGCFEACLNCNGNGSFKKEGFISLKHIYT